VGVVEGVGEIVSGNVGVMEVDFGWTVPVPLGLGNSGVRVGVGVELSTEVVVYVGLGEEPGNFGLGVGEGEAIGYSVEVGVSEGVCRGSGVRVFLEGPSRNASFNDLLGAAMPA
jgi:hypothetical protein